MRALLGILVLALTTGTAFAGSPPVGETTQPQRSLCPMECICYDWDFAVSDHGFMGGNSCDTGGAPVWEYGATTYVPGAPGNVWGTILNGDYVNDSGDALISPAFMVTEDCSMMEVLHYYDIENSYDGGNVTANGTIIYPDTGYSGVVSTSASFYAWCVDMEEGYYGSSSVWVTTCFFLDSFIGQSVEVSFDFGSDSSVTYPGWYIAYVKIGGSGATPTHDNTWGEIKGLFH